MYLKSAIEGVVIKWATQIHAVLQNNSSEAGAGLNPVPSVGKIKIQVKILPRKPSLFHYIEITFWNWRLRNLQFIYEQLRDQRVKSMAVILEKTDSAYFACFKDLFKSVVAGIFIFKWG